MLDLPNDPMMLFSVINMRLRDIYPSLDALCDDLHVDKKEIIDRLAAAGFEYNEQQEYDCFFHLDDCSVIDLISLSKKR